LSPFVCNHDGSCEEIRLCCTETEMTLTRKDAERIEALGYKKEDFMVRVMAGFCELRNVDGHCFFYDTETKKCRIYENRPEGCRYYPIIYDTRKRKCVLDTDCPSAITVNREEIRKVCHRVRKLVETLREEAAHGESPC
jgi:Fe-S-cluster containining protein